MFFLLYSFGLGFLADSRQVLLFVASPNHILGADDGGSAKERAFICNVALPSFYNVEGECIQSGSAPFRSPEYEESSYQKTYMCYEPLKQDDGHDLNFICTPLCWTTWSPVHIDTTSTPLLTCIILPLDIYIPDVYDSRRYKNMCASPARHLQPHPVLFIKRLLAHYRLLVEFDDSIGSQLDIWASVRHFKPVALFSCPFIGPATFSLSFSTPTTPWWAL